jgi:hypothetical protein
VAKAIYGKDEAAIKEMAARLQLIDDYLAFLDKEGQYDIIGSSSEDFVEAQKIVTAAKNHQKDPKFLAKLKAILFYQTRTTLHLDDARCTGDLEGFHVVPGQGILHGYPTHELRKLNRPGRRKASPLERDDQIFNRPRPFPLRG